MSRTRMLVACLALVGLAGCKREAPEATRTRQGPDPLILGAEDIARVVSGSVITGPIISGQLQAQEQATTRAQLSGSLSDVNASAGQHVKRGQVLARIRAVAEREAVGSAEAAVRTAQTDLTVAVRDEERTAVLVKAGALAQRDLEQSRSAVAAARARVAEAEARLASAREQLSEAVVRAPITGVISTAAVNTGDIVAVGAELFTIVNPYTLELRASVPADNLATLKTGTPVIFTVQGYGGREFQGTVRRINPTADPATGQVEVFASIPNDAGILIGGLYAQGRLGTGSKNTLVVPGGAVKSRGDSSFVLKLVNNQVATQTVTLGARDERTGRVEITSGLSVGDIVLVGPAADIQPGAPVQLRQPAAAQAR